MPQSEPSEGSTLENRKGAAFARSFLIFAISALPAAAAQWQDAGGAVWQYNTIANEGAILTGVELDAENCKNVSIPAEICNLEVQEIAGSAFAFAPFEGTLTLPKGIRRIGTAAFDGASAISAFHVDSANPYYSSIGGCIVTKDGKSLVAIPPDCTLAEIPDGVARLDDISVFDFNARYETLIVPASVESVCDGLWGAMSALENVVFMGDVPQGFAATLFGEYHLGEWWPSSVKTVRYLQKYSANWQKISLSPGNVRLESLLPDAAALTGQAQRLLGGAASLDDAVPGVFYALSAGSTLAELEENCKKPAFSRAETQNIAFSVPPSGIGSLFLRLHAGEDASAQ